MNSIFNRADSREVYSRFTFRKTPKIAATTWINRAHPMKNPSNPKNNASAGRMVGFAFSYTPICTNYQPEEKTEFNEGLADRRPHTPKCGR